MGNDFSSIIRRVGVITKIDISNAHYIFNNALRKIFNNSPKEYTIIDHGYCNVLIKAHRVHCSTLNPYHLIILFALIHGYMDPFRLMRLLFNYHLFRRKNNIHYRRFNDDIYRFMIETPFALL